MIINLPGKSFPDQRIECWDYYRTMMPTKLVEKKVVGTAVKKLPGKWMYNFDYHYIFIGKITLNNIKLMIL
jgi:hypothetical protein